ncbi:biotin transporter BioY [Carnobacterium gallinarum]|uniref:biotin transporter BioY n=1 Tax=Carnobacterium gallinarum TaxID=2749 RepID=UPI000551119A|nr:biotin transporter BioY [Carnobacterium gallinarum]
MRNEKLKQLILNAEFAIMLAIIAQITIPFGPIPLTGQTFAVGMIATILGGWNAMISVCIYLLLGLIGIPVFAGFSSGLGALLGPTGGFLIGFIFNAFITGWLLEKTSFTLSWAVFANLIGALVTLLFGSIWLKYGAGMEWTAAFNGGFIPFILPGIIKGILAAICGIAVRKRLVHAHYLPE